MMTNKRELKKSINYICSDLFAECVAANLYSGKPNKENADAILSSLFIMILCVAYLILSRECPLVNTIKT